MKYNVGDIVKVPWGQLGMVTHIYPPETHEQPYYRVRFLGRNGGQMFIEQNLVPLLEDTCQT